MFRRRLHQSHISAPFLSQPFPPASGSLFSWTNTAFILQGEYGFACPAQAQDDQIEAVGGLLPRGKLTQCDEFSCLNLTINAPQDALGDEKRSLPVMAYVHGGAFKVGGHISAFHGESSSTQCFKVLIICIETTKLVDLSIREARPAVLVSIQLVAC